MVKPELETGRFLLRGNSYRIKEGVLGARLSVLYNSFSRLSYHLEHKVCRDPDDLVLISSREKIFRTEACRQAGGRAVVVWRRITAQPLWGCSWHGFVGLTCPKNCAVGHEPSCGLEEIYEGCSLPALWNHGERKHPRIGRVGNRGTACLLGFQWCFGSSTPYTFQGNSKATRHGEINYAFWLFGQTSCQKLCKLVAFMVLEEGSLPSKDLLMHLREQKTVAKPVTLWDSGCVSSRYSPTLPGPSLKCTAHIYGRHGNLYFEVEESLKVTTCTDQTQGLIGACTERKPVSSYWKRTLCDRGMNNLF